MTVENSGDQDRPTGEVVIRRDQGIARRLRGAEYLAGERLKIDDVLVASDEPDSKLHEFEQTE